MAGDHEAKLEIQQLFPKLNLADFEITSPQDYFYNCFAWAGSDDQNVWQPSTNPIYCWLTGEIGDTPDNFKKQFAFLGYKEQTENANFEEGVEKIAFYIDRDGIVRHASRQLEDGQWTSKLGQGGHDIRYKKLDGLECEDYGCVGFILKRLKSENKEEK